MGKVCSVSGQSDVEFKRNQNQFPQPDVVVVEAGCRTAVCFRPCVADQPWLYEQTPAQAIACSHMSLGTEDCRVQLKGDPKASPGHERPMNLFRQTSLSAVHSNQNTCKTPLWQD